MTLIRQLASMFAEDGRFRLLVCRFVECNITDVLQVIDSIMALFRVDYSGRGELAERQQKLNQMLNALTSISEQYNIAVFITNQVLNILVETLIAFIIDCQLGPSRSRCDHDVRGK